MCCALACYLVENGVPKQSIVILTPYKGQLMQLKNVITKDSRSTRLNLLSRNPQDKDGGEIKLESGFSYEVIRELMRKRHRVGYTNGSYGGYQAIMYDVENGVYYGASESRKDIRLSHNGQRTKEVRCRSSNNEKF